MKDWKIKRFCLFTGAEYEASLGLGGYEHSTDTLAQMKKWLLDNITNDDYCFEEWQVDDLKKGETVLCELDDNEFVKTLFQMRASAHLKKQEIAQEMEKQRKEWSKNPDRLPK